MRIPRVRVEDYVASGFLGIAVGCVESGWIFAAMLAGAGAYACVKASWQKDIAEPPR